MSLLLTFYARQDHTYFLFDDPCTFIRGKDLEYSCRRTQTLVRFFSLNVFCKDLLSINSSSSFVLVNIRKVLHLHISPQHHQETFQKRRASPVYMLLRMNVTVFAGNIIYLVEFIITFFIYI